MLHLREKVPRGKGDVNRVRAYSSTDPYDKELGEWGEHLKNGHFPVGVGRVKPLTDPEGANPSLCLLVIRARGTKTSRDESNEAKELEISTPRDKFPRGDKELATVQRRKSVQDPPIMARSGLEYLGDGGGGVEKSALERPLRPASLERGNGSGEERPDSRNPSDDPRLPLRDQLLQRGWLEEKRARPTITTSQYSEEVSWDLLVGS